MRSRTRYKAAKQLLAGFRNIPQPIIGAVMDQLASEHTNYNDKQFMISTGYLLKYSVYRNKTMKVTSLKLTSNNIQTD